MSNRTPLSEAEVTQFLKHHPLWHVEGAALCRTYEATAFLRGIAFVDRVAQLA